MWVVAGEAHFLVRFTVLQTQSYPVAAQRIYLGAYSRLKHVRIGGVDFASRQCDLARMSSERLVARSEQDAELSRLLVQQYEHSC